MTSTRPLIEICLGDAQGVLAAQNGGADRVELCSDLLEGGLTPTVGAFRTARRLADKIKINVMIRPRGGDFLYSEEEFETMKEDVRIFKQEGADGLVFGLLASDGSIDVERTAELIELCGDTPVTFHRAFDMTRDAKASLETLISLGVKRVLTSGQEPTAVEGSALLKELVQQAGDRIIVMPGCGINENNLKKLQKTVGAKEYHMSASYELKSAMKYLPDKIKMGDNVIKTTSEKRVSDICRIC